MSKDDVRAGVYVVVVILLALWLEDRVRYHVGAGVTKTYENGRTVERWLHEQIT